MNDQLKEQGLSEKGVVRVLNRIEAIESQQDSKLSEIKESIRDFKDLRAEGREARKKAIRERVESFREDFDDNSVFLLETGEETREELGSLSDDFGVNEKEIANFIFNLSIAKIDILESYLVERLKYKGLISDEKAEEYISPAKVRVLSE